MFNDLISQHTKLNKEVVSPVVDEQPTKKRGTAKSLSERQEAWLEKANEVHDSKYLYIISQYEHYKSSMVIVCPHHGEFIQNADYHVRGHGCPKCNAKSGKRNARLTTAEFVKRSKKLYGDRFDYSKTTYTNTRTKLEIRCRKHDHTFSLRPDSHFSGNGGCIHCAKEKASDKSARWWDK